MLGHNHDDDDVAVCSAGYGSVREREIEAHGVYILSSFIQVPAEHRV